MAQKEPMLEMMKPIAEMMNSIHPNKCIFSLSISNAPQNSSLRIGKSSCFFGKPKKHSVKQR
jgi:hypothetical protein